MAHTPECVPPDEVGARGSCVCPEPILASWEIRLWCDCPACNNFVDLLEYADFWDGRELDFGEHDTPRSRAVEVDCPKCGHEFEVKTTY